MKYFLKSAYPCAIKTDHDFVEINENDTLELENEKIIFVYPQNKLSSFYINLQNLQENSRFSVINHNKKTVIFLEKEKSINFCQKETLFFGGNQCEICVAGNYVSFETKSKKVDTQFFPICKKYRIFKIKNFACLELEKDFFAYDMAKNHLSHFSGDKISFENDKLSVTKNFHDSMQRQKNSTYIFEDDIKLQEEAFSLSQNKQIDELVPFQMLESVKAKDYVKAIENLAENLKNDINEENIKDFFGNITEFLPLSTTEFITICGNKKNYVTFSLQNKKIDDITIDSI